MRLGRGSILGFTLAAVVAVPAAIAPAGADDDEAPVVLTAVDRSSGPEQDPAQVAARVDSLAKSKKMGDNAGTLIIDAETGRPLYDDDGGLALIPASTNKIPTAAALLHYGGPNRTLQTRVTTSGTDIYLVGGGDPLLTSRKVKARPGEPVYPRPTSLRQLAADTAAALRTQGSATVALRVDDSLFEGPAWEPTWPEYYRTQGIVAPVSALIVDDGRVGGEWGPIAEDPALAAGDVFADLLKARGVKVSGVKRDRSPETAQEIASVSSAPVYEMVGQSLNTSDNQTAENLFRLAGRYAGFGGSFDGGGKAVTKALEEMGVSTVMSSFRDGSGLSREDRLTPNLLTELLRRVVRAQDGLWPIASGLAVAGVSGTLEGRFRTIQTEPAAGWLRGKTGTLNYVSSLAGFVQSESGRMLAFASIANDAKSPFEAAAQIDEMMAAAAACGCPGNSR